MIKNPFKQKELAEMYSELELELARKLGHADLDDPEMVRVVWRPVAMVLIVGLAKETDEAVMEPKTGLRHDEFIVALKCARIVLETFREDNV